MICKNGETKPGTTTVTFEKNGSVVVIKDVPAQICQNCGQYYLNADMSEKVLALAQESVNKGIEVEVMHLQLI